MVYAIMSYNDGIKVQMNGAPYGINSSGINSDIESSSATRYNVSIDPNEQKRIIKDIEGLEKEESFAKRHPTLVKLLTIAAIVLVVGIIILSVMKVAKNIKQSKQEEKIQSKENDKKDWQDCKDKKAEIEKTPEAERTQEQKDQLALCNEKINKYEASYGSPAKLDDQLESLRNESVTATGSKSADTAIKAVGITATTLGAIGTAAGIGAAIYKNSKDSNSAEQLMDFNKDNLAETISVNRELQGIYNSGVKEIASENIDNKKNFVKESGNQYIKGVKAGKYQFNTRDVVGFGDDIPIRNVNEGRPDNSLDTIASVSTNVSQSNVL